MTLSLWLATDDPHLLRRPLNFHKQVWLSLLWGSLLLSPGSWCEEDFVCALQESLVGMEFDFNMIVLILPFCCKLLLCSLDVGYLSLVGSNILLSMVVQQLVAILVFSQKMNIMYGCES